MGSVVLCGCEIWKMITAKIDKLKVLEMWLWRRLEWISWMDKKYNEEGLTMVKENRCRMRTIYQRKKNWIGLVLRGDGLLRDVLEGRMLGKRPRGRPRRRIEEERSGENGCHGPA